MNSKKIDLKELLKEKKKIALGGHVRPDGDCIGSVMGLYLYLKQEYPHIQTDVYLEKIPETFRLIKGTDEVRSEVNNNETPYDLFICLDFQVRSLKTQKRRFASIITSATNRLQT